MVMHPLCAVLTVIGEHNADTSIPVSAGITGEGGQRNGLHNRLLLFEVSERIAIGNQTGVEIERL